MDTRRCCNENTLKFELRKSENNLFPLSLFAIYMGVLLLMSGVHTGLLVFMDKVRWNGLVQTIVPMVYWGMVAARLSSLIGNILKLNRLEHQRITPEVEIYDVCRQLCESVFLFEDALKEKEIDLEADIEDAALIKADASLMELVWNNLLSNAVKYF